VGEVGFPVGKVTKWGVSEETIGKPANFGSSAFNRTEVTGVGGVAGEGVGTMGVSEVGMKGSPARRESVQGSQTVVTGMVAVGAMGFPVGRETKWGVGSTGSPERRGSSGEMSTCVTGGTVGTVTGVATGALMGSLTGAVTVPVGAATVGSATGAVGAVPGVVTGTVSGEAVVSVTGVEGPEPS